MPHHRVLKENPNRTLRESLSGNLEATAGRQTCAFRRTPSQSLEENPHNSPHDSKNNTPYNPENNPLNPKEYPMGVLKV